MKILLLIAFTTIIFSCNNNSGSAKIYQDSASYYSNKLQALTDSGYTQNDSLNMERKTRRVIYVTMRQYYIDKMDEAKK